MGDRVDTGVEEYKMVVICWYDRLVVSTVLFWAVYFTLGQSSGLQA